MENLQEERQERVILVGICLAGDPEAEESLDELGELAATAGALVVGRVLQHMDSIHPGTYIGSGKIDELALIMDETEADAVICDDELSPAQIRTLQQLLDCKVLDRTLLILDIFAARAVTSEGRIQVELAQLQYRMTRLSELGRSLSRLGGGIGTRGPGEKKLETDRRLIRRRISRLKEDLRESSRHRELLRSGRQKNLRPTAAIVGYTNAGKSTLLNALTGAGVLEEDKLFATLDPTTRAMVLEDGQEILLTDTVGFIRKLPHHLVDAFHSTLEEAVYADLIIHVVDASGPEPEHRIRIVYETLRELGLKDKKILTVFNKMDLAGSRGRYLRDENTDYTLKISARTGEGLDELRKLIGELATENQVLIERLYRYEDAGRIALIRRYGQLICEDYREDGIAVRAYVPMEIYGNV